MTEIGEGIAVAIIRQAEGQCIFCGKADHENIKKDVINPTKWKRDTISGVGGRFLDKKLSIYPFKQSPPAVYRSEGHHCLAFSSFIMGAQSKPPNPQDRFAVLNHYLKEKGYTPNNKDNTIDLPGRKKENDLDAHAQFKEYAIAAREGKPLQLHIGGHTDEFMSASNAMIRDIVTMLKKK